MNLWREPHPDFQSYSLANLIILSEPIVFAVFGQQNRPDPAVLMAAQREAMKPLAIFDGVWRGTAWTLLPNGEKHSVTHTERVGSFMSGSVKVIEGREYKADGTVAFNAFAPFLITQRAAYSRISRLRI